MSLHLLKLGLGRVGHSLGRLASDHVEGSSSHKLPLVVKSGRLTGHIWPDVERTIAFLVDGQLALLLLCGRDNRLADRLPKIVIVSTQ